MTQQVTCQDGTPCPFGSCDPGACRRKVGARIVPAAQCLPLHAESNVSAAAAEGEETFRMLGPPNGLHGANLADLARPTAVNESERQLDAINIIFDGPPGPEAPGFVEVETDDGRGVRVGEWIEREGCMWALRIKRHDLAPDWRSIETAPRGRTLFLYEDGTYYTGSFVRETDHGAKVFVRDLDSGYGEPTHWMPLPAPPENPK